MLSHGTLLFDSELEVLKNVLESNLDIIKSKGVKSIKSEVVNIKEFTDHSIDMNTFFNKLVAGVSEFFGDSEEYQLSGKDWDRIYQLSEDKYKSWQWTYGDSPEFLVRHKFKSNGNNVDTQIQVEHGLIKNIEFVDGAIENSTLFNLQAKLIGERYEIKKI